MISRGDVFGAAVSRWKTGQKGKLLLKESYLGCI
jgi:hypothetical protein